MVFDIHNIEGKHEWKFRSEISNAIHKLQEEYEIKLSTVTSGKMNRGDIFGSGQYIAKSISGSNGVATQMVMWKRIAIFYEEKYVDRF